MGEREEPDGGWAGDLPARSAAARLRPLLPEVDRLVRSGVSHEAILSKLQDGGHAISLATFRKSLYEYRKGREKGRLDERSEATQSVPGVRDQVAAAQAQPLPERDTPAGLDGERVDPTGTPESSMTAAERVALALDPARRNAVADQYMKPKTRPRLGSLNKG